MTNDPEQIKADIEATRAELSRDVDALAETVRPANVVQRQKDKVTSKVFGAKDSVMGSAAGAKDSVMGSARLGAVRLRRRPAHHRRRHLVRSARRTPADAGQPARRGPDRPRRRLAGRARCCRRPAPSARRPARLKEKAAPLAHEVADMAKEAAQNLQEPAQQAVQEVKSAGTEAVETVKAEGTSTAADVKDSAKDSAQTVKESQQNS